jgi:hypothetical protein
MADLLSEINALIAVGVDPTVAANTVNTERARKAHQGKTSFICSSFIVFTLLFVFSCPYSPLISILLFYSCFSSNLGFGWLS